MIDYGVRLNIRGSAMPFEKANYALVAAVSSHGIERGAVTSFDRNPGLLRRLKNFIDAIATNSVCHKNALQVSSLRSQRLEHRHDPVYAIHSRHSNPVDL